MKRQAFYFDLPQELIAQYPLENRSDSRLLSYNLASKKITHLQFRDIASLLQPGDLLVMNDTKVIPARLFGHKVSGGKVEVFVERILSEETFLAQVRASKALRPGTRVILEEGRFIEILMKEEDLFLCQANEPILAILEALGHVPLPPYIKRSDDEQDLCRYQTVYAKHKGSVAAPTAGLHFDEPVLRSLVEKGLNLAYLTLHVGAGTFKPVRSEEIHDHKMHFEHYRISQALCDAIYATKASKNRVIAVGTTVLRSLESAARLGQLTPLDDKTDIFIYPGFEFKICDGLLTNFHLPESTLFMLVSAFIGHPEAMNVYQEAITKKYRFFSYGDASLFL